MNKRIVSDEIRERARKIKLLLMDCDGVLTDGRLYFTEKGETMKVFHVRDGQGLALWHKAGYRSGIITGRDAENILKARAAELGIDYIKARSQDKAKDFEDVLRSEQINAEEVAFIGDDIGDIVLLKVVGLAVAVADAVSEVLPHVHYQTSLNGGFGAVRELVDLLIKSKQND
jgi:3-deoxy-D-manno-octulosonate 8-phosphate phosphatase (KDO 8-P phosphatase)